MTQDAGRYFQREPEYVGQKFCFYSIDTRGEVEMVVQRKADLPDSEAWFDVSCGFYELWQKAGVPVRFDRVFDRLPRAFVGREIVGVPLKVMLRERTTDTTRVEAVLLERREDYASQVLVPDVLNGIGVYGASADTGRRTLRSWMEFDFPGTDAPGCDTAEYRIELVAQMGKIAKQAYQAAFRGLEWTGLRLEYLVLEFGVATDNGDLLIATSVDADWAGISHMDGEPSRWVRDDPELISRCLVMVNEAMSHNQWPPPVPA